jgi:hypothetical protein
MTSGSPLTRMQRCQSEIVGMQGAERSRNLRECLINRAEGERLIARDCSRQYRSLPASPATDKTTFQKQCIATGLQASHKELPRRKAAEPAQYTNAPSAPTAEGSAEDKPPAP